MNNGHGRLGACFTFISEPSTFFSSRVCDKNARVYNFAESEITDRIEAVFAVGKLKWGLFSPGGFSCAFLVAFSIISLRISWSPSFNQGIKSKLTFSSVRGWNKPPRDRTYRGRGGCSMIDSAEEERRKPVRRFSPQQCGGHRAQQSHTLTKISLGRPNSWLRLASG